MPPSLKSDGSAARYQAFISGYSVLVAPPTFQQPSLIMWPLSNTSASQEGILNKGRTKVSFKTTSNNPSTMRNWQFPILLPYNNTFLEFLCSTNNIPFVDLAYFEGLEASIRAWPDSVFIFFHQWWRHCFCCFISWSPPQEIKKFTYLKIVKVEILVSYMP